MNKLALAVLVALITLGAGWFLLEGGGGRGAADTAPENARTEVPEPEREPTELATPSGASQDTPARREKPARARVVEEESFDLASALWLDVGVVIPPGLPPEDRPMLLGFARKDLEDYEEWGARQLGEKLVLDDSFTAELGDEHHWARRPLGARVRLPFPPGASEGVLFLQSRYLHLDPVEVALSTSGAVMLEPELGGWVSGRCVFPDAAPAAADVSIEFDGRERGGGIMGFARPDARDARVGEDLRFELRALSAQRKYAVQAKARGFVGHFELSFEIAPGEHREIELAFRAGATVSGTVRGEGQPLPGARVRAQVKGTLPWNDDLSVESGADGAFRLDGLPGGTLTLHADKDGWLEARGEPLELVEGREVSGIVLGLGTGKRIRGTVMWPDGAPAEGARVRALKARESWMQELVESKTGADGSFVLGGLEEDAVEVFASRQGRESERKQPVQLRAGERVPLEEEVEPDEGEHSNWMARASAVAPDTTGLVLTLQPPHPVAGRVRDDAGAPVTEFRVVAYPAGRPENSPEKSEREFQASDGRFALEVGQQGEWLLHARSSEGDHRGEDVALSVPQGGAELVLVLPRASSVSGRVVDPGGRPVPGAQIHVTDDPRGAAFAFFGEGEAESDADGRFTIPSAQSGSYVHASHEDWAPSENVALELAPGETRSDLVLALRVGARVTGELFNAEGKPDPGKNVNIASGAMAAMAFGLGGEDSSMTDSAGRFAFEHVTPGKVTVSAVPSEEELLARFQEGGDQEAAFLSMMSDMRTASVEVADGGEAHVVLGSKPKRPVRVHGRVTEAGSALAEKQVFAFAEGGALLSGMKLARTDADGRYELVLDRPGDYVFGIGQSQGLEGTGTPFYVEVPEAQEFEQDFALPLGRIAGVVLGPDGAATGVPIRLISTAGMIGLDDLSESHRASSGGDGAFAFEHLAPGEYALHVGSALGDDSGGERYGQLVVDGIEVEPDRAVEGLVVRLSAPGKLAGIVRDAAGAPAGGLTIFVRDAAGRAISASGCVSDASGRFTYSGIAPGRITASARSPKLVSPESGPVEIRAGETSQVELVVNTGTFLLVSLIDDDRSVRARLRVLDESGRRVDDLFGMEEFMAVLSEGFSSRERRIGPLAPGKYTLVATDLDGKDAKKSVLVEAGQEERNVKLRLR